MSLWDIQRDLGIGILGLGVWDISFYRLIYQNVEITRDIDAGVERLEFCTPYGTLTCCDKMAEELKDAAGTGARIEYPYKSVEDYDALQFLIDHTEVVENHEAYKDLIDSIGSDGLALPYSGHLPAHQLMLFFMGYETFYHELNDSPTKIERLIESLTVQQRKISNLAPECPATAFEVDANYDEQMTPPVIFDRLFAPFYQETKDLLSSRDKILVVHGDGEMNLLLTKLMECGIQVVEALTPKLMTSIEIRRTRQLWGDRVAMWGGLPYVLLTEYYSDDELERYLVDLFQSVAPGDRFILGFGDNVPTDAVFGRIQRITEYWTKHGRYPLVLSHADMDG